MLLALLSKIALKCLSKFLHPVQVGGEFLLAALAGSLSPLALSRSFFLLLWLAVPDADACLKGCKVCFRAYTGETSLTVKRVVYDLVFLLIVLSCVVGRSLPLLTCFLLYDAQHHLADTRDCF